MLVEVVGIGTSSFGLWSISILIYFLAIDRKSHHNPLAADEINLKSTKESNQFFRG
jgi:hypothetical protein